MNRVKAMYVQKLYCVMNKRGNLIDGYVGY